MLGVARGPHFDKIIEAFFQLQLQGRARNPQDRVPALRKLAGIKAPKKPKPPKEEPPAKGKAGKKEKVKEAGAGETKGAPTAPPVKPTAASKLGVSAPAKGVRLRFPRPKQPEKPAPAPAKKPAKPSPRKKPARKKKAPPKKKKRR
jgi:hypothetical protein